MNSVFLILIYVFVFLTKVIRELHLGERSGEPYILILA